MEAPHPNPKQELVSITPGLLSFAAELQPPLPSLGLNSRPAQSPSGYASAGDGRLRGATLGMGDDRAKHPKVVISIDCFKFVLI